MASALPENSACFSLAEIVQATSGASSGAAAGAHEVKGVATDTRADVRGRLFVALAGERFDGHDHVGAAVQGGATALLVERDVGELGVPVIRVASTLAALGDLAAFHRRRWGGTLVAVAGSAGKTTTKSAIAAVLRTIAPDAVHEARGNLNNFVGVPLVLLGILPEHRVCVVEIGTNAPGEVAALASRAAPDIAVLTLVALEHTQGLVDLDGVEREESAIFHELSPSAVAIGNGDDPRVRAQVSKARAKTRLRYGFSEGADVRGMRRESASAAGQRLAVSGRFGTLALDVALLGEAGAYAVLAAVTVGEVVAKRALDGRRVSEALSGAGEPGRLEPHELEDGTIVLDDTYNANPASVLASVRTASEVATARRAGLVLVVGEMRELGAQSRVEHERLGAVFGRSGARELVAVGGDAELYVEPARSGGVQARFANDAETGLELARAVMQPGDVVLVKASRGVRAERIVLGLLAAGQRPRGGNAA